jgi:integrase/recombinase XerD
MKKLPDLNFKSFLADVIRDYVDYLDSLGYCMQAQRCNLRVIDRLFAENNIESMQQCDNRFWLQVLDRYQNRLKGSTLRGWRSAFNGLCRYLVRQGLLSQNPIETFAVPPIQNYRPYVFSIEELRRFFTFLQTQADSPDNDTAVSFQFRTQYVLYYLLYACGLRVSEGVRLAVEDYSSSEGTIFIKPSKFHKDRLIPIGVRVASNLESLLELRRRMFGIPPEGLFFLSLRDRQPYTASSASQYFQKTMRHLGIYRPAFTYRNCTHGTPHLHELRRAFAVHRLMRWYREQADVDAKLPLLATYMGHARFEYTKTYLTLTQQLLAEAGHRFARRFDHLDWMPHDPELG